LSEEAEEGDEVEGKTRKKTWGETRIRERFRERQRKKKRGRKREREREREECGVRERTSELLSGHRCASNISHVVIATESVYRAVLQLIKERGGTAARRRLLRSFN